MLFALADAFVAPKSSSHLESDWSLVLPPSAEKKRVSARITPAKKYGQSGYLSYFEYNRYLFI